MKRKLLLTAICIISMAWLTAYAGETEPNDTKAQANTLTLNGNNSGAIGASADEDWWKITTTGDGKLDVTITVGNGQYIRCWIYDNDGTTQLNYAEPNSTATLSTDGLATGTYYVRLVSYYNGGTPSYTISNTLTVPTQAIDVEPNGNRAQAKVFPIGGSRTGHINYYYNLVRDTADWYKITTTADGKLDITITLTNGQYIRCWLYDNDGVTQLNYSEPNATTVQSTDGLAAGTYYVKIMSYYSNGFIPYTISNTFTTPAQANDLEPNGTKAQALTLGLNSSITGHINYYYNNARDSSDWYKVTTNADGRLRLRVTPENGQYIQCWLYDNDGTTQLNYFSPSGTSDLSTDGLAAGTYYIQIKSYYGNGYIPYTLADSLFLPAEPNDSEPNGTLAQAKNFNLNSTKKGHINYYYNLLRDDDDWYKITTTLDGMISLTMTSGNGQYIQVWLYDNDGTTQLNYMAPYSTQTINTDGLAAGTYYVRIHTYYSNGYIPYTLSNTFTPYTYTNDGAAEPNDAPYQAKVFNSNDSITGHVNFYQNGNTRNTVDWWKLDYSGTGNLTINFYEEPGKVNGATHYKQIWIYKDTAASQIYYAAPSSGLLTINLTSLAEGPYWIRVQSYYGSDHISYALTNSYTEVAPKPKNLEGDTATTCQSKNTVAFKISKSTGGPYTVQLYRYGTAYGSPTIVPDKKKFSYKNLPQGSYYITAQAEGSAIVATGKEVEVMPEPTGTNTSGIASTQAVANWTVLSCAKYYNVQYRVHGTLDWTKKKTNGNVGSYTIKNLAANTQYDWQVSAVDSANGADANSAYTDSLVFTTLTLDGSFAKSGISNGSSNTLSGDLNIYPNPVVSYFVIQLSANIKGNVGATLKDINGKAVWAMTNTNAQALQNKQVSVSNLQPGAYFLQVIDEAGRMMSKKIIVSK